MAVDGIGAAVKRMASQNSTRACRTSEMATAGIRRDGMGSPLCSKSARPARQDGAQARRRCRENV